MPQRDDYPNGAGSVGRPCGGDRATATMGRRPWGSLRWSGLWSAVKLEGPQTTTNPTYTIRSSNKHLLQVSLMYSTPSRRSLLMAAQSLRDILPSLSFHFSPAMLSSGSEKTVKLQNHNISHNEYVVTYLLPLN